MKRALKCLRRSVCEYHQLDAESQKQLDAVYTLVGVILILLGGALWSYIPGVASFTQITETGVIGIVFNGLTMFAIAWVVMATLSVIYAGLTAGLQFTRRLEYAEEAPLPGELRLAWLRHIVIPPPLSDLVLCLIFTLTTLVGCTFGVYLMALVTPLGYMFSNPCTNLTAGDLSLLCHRTPGECACGAFSGFFAVGLGALV